MIIEYTYSARDLKKKCWGCKYFLNDILTENGQPVKDEWRGRCVCETNKVKNRDRAITDKACSWKTTEEAE